MWISDSWKDYELLDTSDGERLERWGRYVLVRPDPQVIWQTDRPRALWERADAGYKRSRSGGGAWSENTLPEKWRISYGPLTFRIQPTGFKHTGLFPEQATNWDWFSDLIRGANRPIKVLNLFAYTGGATVAAAAAGASVCHVDAARGMVEAAKENAALSGLADKPIRYIVDDCKKFVEREIRRGNHYDAVIMDPPSYGRGPGGRGLEDRGKHRCSYYVGLGCAFRPTSVLSSEFLYDRAFGFRYAVYDRAANYQALWRSCRGGGAWPPRDQQWGDPSLRRQCALCVLR